MVDGKTSIWIWRGVINGERRGEGTGSKGSFFPLLSLLSFWLPEIVDILGTQMREDNLHFINNKLHTVVEVGPFEC